MCGIVALFARHKPISTEVTQRATQSLRHRGPVSQRYWIAPDGRVALGHARLSIIDLATGDQPIGVEMLHPNGRYVTLIPPQRQHFF